MPDLFKELLPSILENKVEIIDENSPEKDYPAFIVNRALSLHYDCILQANEMNMHHDLDNIVQYRFYINSIKGYKRPFVKWPKKEKIENIEHVAEYYNISYQKAKEALSLLSDEQIDVIKEKTRKGGMNDKR